MADMQPTQRSPSSGVVADLNAEGFEEAEEIGRGGFGVVYRCKQPDLDRIVAVKVLTSDLDAESMQRFIREQQAMGRLSGHPHIAAVFQVGTTSSGHPYLVMPYHARGSLEQRIRNFGPLDWTATLRLGVKMAGALEAAHRVGTLHRDVKPGNILITDYGEPQLTDFGIARTAGGFRTTTGIITGSPAFTAPEVLRGEPSTPASDVYGLGATLFCALTGHVAYERHTGEQVLAHFLRVAAQPIPDLRAEGMPDDVCTAIEHAMAGDSAQRPESALALGEELRAVQEHRGVPVDVMVLPIAPGPRKPPPAATVRRRERPTAPPTPATKYRPPTPARTPITRKRLLDLLRSGSRKRLTFIHAPSGFGKTTLAAQWRDELANAGTPVAWLTVDEDDNNVAWFLAHLVEAIRGPRPNLADELDRVLEVHPDDAERYVLTALIDDLHSHDDRVTVVLDDWQRVTDESSLAAVRFLLEHGCHHLPIIVTSTSRSGLPLSRLRIDGELEEIDSSALRFDVDEVRHFLAEAGGLHLSDADVEALTETTDGWAAALQLAVLSLRAGDDPAHLVDSLSAHADIGEFLAENVLDALEPDMLEFLTKTSICGRICGALASAVTGDEHARAMLEDIEDRGLFLQRIDPNREWFRYHQLFAGYLRRRLERDRSEEIEALHYRASEWFARHELLNDAVDHALAAGNPDRAVDLIEQGGGYLLERSKMTTLVGIVAKLPPQSIQSRPRIQLFLSWVYLVLRRPEPAAAALARFTAALDQAELTDAERADLRAEADVLAGTREMFADRIEQGDRLIRAVLSRLDDFSPRVAGVAVNIAAIAAIHRFDFDAARRWQQRAVPYHDATGPFLRVYGRCFAGIAEREQLLIPAADEAFRDAVEFATTTMGPHSHAARLASALLGELRYETGDVDTAAELLLESLGLAEEGGGGVDFMIATYATGARVEAVRGDLRAAAKRLNDGMASAERMALPRLAARLRNERIRLGLGLAPDEIERLVGRRELRHDDGIATLIAELDEDSAIRLLLTAYPPDRHDEACERARALLTSIESAPRPLAAVRARLLLGTALRRAGRAEDAARELAAAVATCDEAGLVRLPIDAMRDLPGPDAR
ncbi:serine/threonine-protein kinase [Nocardia bhagyanarayanae]|uniref:Serine/threonine-protein kinase PknK n=1 Tax=Nocardia bhagyanarayanae TaxID=1215925 RepID=A0A543FF28_9NOCA|nr:serine/threonine-protein kinase PknK [Nocardia bhagyanarayanae]